MVKSASWMGLRLVALTCVCFLSHACAPAPPQPPAASAFSPTDLARLARLQQSLDQLNSELDGGASSPAAIDTIRQELEELLSAMGQESDLPFKASLERVVAILSESDGEPSSEQTNDVRNEILDMVEWLKVNDTGQASAGPGPAPTRPATGSPGSAPAGPGPGSGPSPGRPGPPGAFGGSGGAPPGLDTDQMRLGIERKQRSAKETVWRARAKATRAAVTQTRAMYEQTKSIQPRPGDSPALIEQSQALVKQAMEAAEQAEADLREEARRASVPPGWLR